MKKIIPLVCSLLMVAILAACSGAGSASYNPATCEELAQKIKDHKEFTSDEYDQVIDQLSAIAKDMQEQTNACGDDKAKLKELRKDENMKQMMEYAIGFAFFIEANRKNLSESNLKHLAEAEKELDALKNE